jgi:hypothetical protein
MLEPMSAHTEPGVTRDSALEVLAFLVTAARTQTEEAAEYGPMRLLSAAHRLAGAIGPRVSEGTKEFVDGSLRRMPPLAVPRDGRDDYVATLDNVCRELAEHLTSRFAPGPA